MALTPDDSKHALQIQAGILGRNAGHKFEDTIAAEINEFVFPLSISNIGSQNVFSGDPAALLMNYICQNRGIKTIKRATAIATGALATSEEGKKWLNVHGVAVSRCKSDIVITITDMNENSYTVGVSTKQCNNKTPTNAQLYFTTAHGFSNLLRTNHINVSERAEIALRQFCGDLGFQPLDSQVSLKGRVIDIRRFFWEEICEEGRNEWEKLFTTFQDEISRLLFQKAYLNDPFVPDFLLHKTKQSLSWKETEVAIYSIDEIIAKSRAYQGFATKEYSVHKGSYPDPTGIAHRAPRFGIIQMQRGGQKQHPDQLQFNLEAGYFYKIK